MEGTRGWGQILPLAAKCSRGWGQMFIGEPFLTTEGRFWNNAVCYETCIDLHKLKAG